MAQEPTSDVAGAPSSAVQAVEGGDASADFAPLAPPPPHEELVNTEDLAEGLDELKAEAASSAEVARQLEELTGVVLSSAEVSTRSASVAANISQEMRLVMEQITASHKRSVQHSRIILGGLLAFLLIGLGTFFAISTRMQQNIRQLDALALAVGKRVVELDATVSAFVETSRTFNELNDQLQKQADLQGKLEHKFEDFQKTVSAVPTQVAEQSAKAVEANLQGLQKQMQALDAKVQTLSNRPQPNPASGQQAVLSEIQKLKKDLEVANAKAAAAVAVAKPKLEAKPEPKPETKLEPKAAEVRPAETKPAPPAAPAAAPAPAVRDKMLVYPRPNN